MTYPITNPTYGTYPWFLLRVGVYLGQNPDTATWGHEEYHLTDVLVQAGLMKFYYPPPVDMQITPHEWSFLRPTGEMTLASGTRIYDLPDDFDRVDGSLVYMDDDYCPIQITSEARIRALRHSSNAQSAPEFAAVRAMACEGTAPQRQEMEFHPTPDSEYRLRYRYHAIPRALTTARPYPLGGTAHAETIAAACLAEAELKKLNVRGDMHAAFMERIVASIAQDSRRGPDVWGYNGDPSTSRGRYDRRAWRDWVTSDITYNGDT